MSFSVCPHGVPILPKSGGQVECGQYAVLYLLQADLGQNLRLCFYIRGWPGYFEFGDADLGDQSCIDGGKHDK